MRHTIHALAMAVAVAALASATARPVVAATPKDPDRETIGAAATPDIRPAEPNATRLERVPTPASAVAGNAAAARDAKPAEITTAEPVNAASLSSAQRLKRAGAPAGSALTGIHFLPNGKAAELSTHLPPAPGARPLSLAQQDQLKRASLAAHRGATATTKLPARHLTAALGAIPRPEWSAAAAPAKPKDVSTIGATGVAPVAIPTPAELQARATSAKAVRAVKPAPVTTSAPRDPSAPAASATKSAPAGSGQEVTR